MGNAAMGTGTTARASSTIIFMYDGRGGNDTVSYCAAGSLRMGGQKALKQIPRLLDYPEPEPELCNTSFIRSFGNPCRMNALQ